MCIDASPQVSAFLLLSRYFLSFKRVCHLFPLIVRTVRTRLRPRDDFHNLSASFSQWSNHAQCKQLIRRPLLQAFQRRLRIRILKNAAWIWRSTAAASRFQTTRTQKVVLRFTQGGKLRAFFRWAEFASEQSRMKSKAKVALFRIMHAHVLYAFISWKQVAVLNKEMRIKAQKILKRWMFGGVSRAFQRWTDITSQSRRLKAKAKTVIYRIKNAQAAKFFNAWHQHIKIRKKNIYRLQTIGRKALSRFLQFELSKTFSHWVCLVREVKKMNQILRKVLFRMMCIFGKAFLCRIKLSMDGVADAGGRGAAYMANSGFGRGGCLNHA